VSDVDNALRRWWERDRPAIERELRRSYRVGSLSDDVLGMLARATREAFLAGWKARDRAEREWQLEVEGT